jgi:hypothetical protein
MLTHKAPHQMLVGSKVGILISYFIQSNGTIGQANHKVIGRYVRPGLMTR